MNNNKQTSGALDGVKVIDLTMLLPGPLTTMHLADMGAEVIKVENPKVADMVRYMGSQMGNDTRKESGMYLMLNRNKKSLTLNIKRPQGREILMKLLEDADILVEGFRPGAMSKMGIGYEELKEKFPRLIYCAISGYGATGPRADSAGHDANFLAVSGMLDTIGDKDHVALPGFQVADVGGGTLTALSGILAALYAREKTGKGQFVDISMADGAFSFLHLTAGEYIASQKLPQRGNTTLTGALPNYNLYKTKDDRWVMLAALEERFFRNFLRRISREDMLEGVNLHHDNLESIAEELKNIFSSKTYKEWSDLFDDPDLCFSGVSNLDEAFNDVQLKAREMIITMQHPDFGEVKMIGSPFKLSETPVQFKSFPPAHSQHTADILNQLGYSQEQQKQLKDKRVI